VLRVHDTLIPTGMTYHLKLKQLHLPLDIPKFCGNRIRSPNPRKSLGMLSRKRRRKLLVFWVITRRSGMEKMTTKMGTRNTTLMIFLPTSGKQPSSWVSIVPLGTMMEKYLSKRRTGLSLQRNNKMQPLL